MVSLSGILRKILLNKAEYCSLCYQIVEENEGSYYLQDEVRLDKESAENVHEILSVVLGKQVLESLSTNTICQKCVETAIRSYRFIKMCKHNVCNLASVINCLQTFTENTLQENYFYKSLFLAVDIDKYIVNDYYDLNKRYQNEVMAFKGFQDITSCLDTIEIKLEPDFSNDIDLDSPKKKPKRKRPPLQPVRLSDIPYEKDNENKYKCIKCPKMYSTPISIKHHYLRVHAPKIFECSKCPKSFGSSWLLKCHIKDGHTKDSHHTVVCSQCGKTYTNYSSLRHHERSHRSQHVCQTCGKVYKGKKAFNNHIEQKLCEKMRKSNAEAKFTCDYCKKKYSQKSALSVHIRLEHEDGKALRCEWCNKKLSSLSRLKDHIVKHTKQKNFNCDTCGGKFVTKASLLYHTRIHTGEKPYKCEHCDMSFLSASRRSEHVKRHHAVADLECDICRGKFKGQSSLTRHRKRHFNISSRLYHRLPSQ